MEKIIKTLIVAILLIGGIQMQSFAQIADPVISSKQLKQEHRIRQGIRSGELTRKEARMLRAEQKRVKLMRMGAKTDGIVTRRERAAVHKNQRIADIHIYRQKHDGHSRN